MRAVRTRGPNGRGPHFDLSDDRLVRQRRARLTGVYGLLGVIVNVPLPFSGGAGVDPQPLAGPLLLAQLALSVYALRRGPRITDRQFTVLQALALVFGVPLMVMSVAPGSLRAIETVLIVPLLLAVMFCGTRREAAILVVLGTAGAIVVTAHRILDPADVLTQSAGVVFVNVLLAVIIRSLRDSARDALLTAKHGEITDPLTGLLNRRGFERLGGPTWRRRALDGLPVMLVVLDLDHFKRINDTLGHEAGDVVLRQVADVLTASTRSTDVLVRLGGEEFAVLGQTEPGEGARFAERLRARIADDLAPVTVSIGVVEIVPEPAGATADAAPDAAPDLWRAVAAADSALYEAKRTGRNRVVAVGALGAVGASAE